MDLDDRIWNLSCAPGRNHKEQRPFLLTSSMFLLTSFHVDYGESLKRYDVFREVSEDDAVLFSTYNTFKVLRLLNFLDLLG